MARIISFDMDGTLVNEDFDDFIWNELIPKLYSDRYHVSINAAKKHCFAEYKKHDGKEYWTSMEFWFKHFNLKNYDHHIDEYSDKIKAYPDAIEVLEYLRTRYILVVITQAPKEFFDVKLKGLKKYFDKIYSSTHHFKSLRKDEGVYQKILKDLKASPSDIIHVGNHKEYDYDIPRKLGMNAVLIDRDGKHPKIKSIKDLKELLHLL